jgi:hypothetical protein
LSSRWPWVAQERQAASGCRARGRGRGPARERRSAERKRAGRHLFARARRAKIDQRYDEEGKLFEGGRGTRGDKFLADPVPSIKSRSCKRGKDSFYGY